MYITNVIPLMKEVWAKWDVRWLMLVSLLLQMLLLLLSPLRKRTSNTLVIGTILYLYMLTDWAANYAAGVITSSDCNAKSNQPLAFWSTFLLVHLGGPDSITAFVLQDNEFWDRHMLALVFQCISASYTFFQTLSRNQLWLPTLLMFGCGFIKYYERTRSLYLACFRNLRDSMLKEPDPGTAYAKMMDEYRVRRKAGLPTHIQMIEEPERLIRAKQGRLNDREVILYGHQFFKVFKRLLVDLECSYYERIQSREFFLLRKAEDAFRVIEVELDFMYDILFAKASVVYNRTGFVLRLFSSAFVVTSFGLFYYEEKRFKPSDVTITYLLLLGTIGLDVIAFFQFCRSNWRTVFNTKCHYANWPLPAKAKPQEEVKQQEKLRSVPTFNLIDCCLRRPQPETEKLMHWFGLRPYFDWLWYVKRGTFTKDLREHIFTEVKSRSELAEYVGHFKEAITARGDWVLRWEVDCNHLLPYVYGMDFDQSLLSWHIATELCYCRDPLKNDHRDCSKLLSDYMLYLVTMQPEIMYGVTDIGKIRLRDTCADVQRVACPCPKREELSTIGVIKYAFQYCCRGIFLSIMKLLSPVFFLFLHLLPSKKYERLERARHPHCYSREKPSIIHLKLCNKILGVNTEVDPVCIKGYRSRSVLFDGCRLAKKLQKLGDRKWEVMSKVWVEMLTYAAVQCRPKTLADQLSKGGELISYVWLLMAHFGLVDHFEAYGPSSSWRSSSEEKFGMNKMFDVYVLCVYHDFFTLQLLFRLLE